MAKRELKKILTEVGYGMGAQNAGALKQELGMKLGEFADKVKKFNELGKKLYEMGDIRKIAEELGQIAENADAYLMKETGGPDGENWFDGVTVKRNMNELKKYVGDFSKLAKEAHTVNQRMTALYEDSGKVLGRYFEIIDDYAQQQGTQDERGKIANAIPGEKLSVGEGRMNEFSDAEEGYDNYVARCKKNGKEPIDYNEYIETIWNTNEGVEETCEGCGKSMEDCTCEGHNHEDELNETPVTKRKYAPPKVVKPQFTSPKSANDPTKVKGIEKRPYTDPQTGKVKMKPTKVGETVNEEEKWIQKAVNPAHKGYCTPMTKSTCTPKRKALAQRFKKGIEKEELGSTCPVCGRENCICNQVKEIQTGLKAISLKEHYYITNKNRFTNDERFFETTRYRNLLEKKKRLNEQLMKLMLEDVTDDYPKEDWVKLPVPKLRYEQGKQFESDLKKKGFKVLRKDWKERTDGQVEFCEFFTKKDDFNECNEYATKNYQQYDTGDEQ